MKRKNLPKYVSHNVRNYATLAPMLLLTLLLAPILTLTWSNTTLAAQAGGIFYSTDTDTFHARLTKPKITLAEGDKLFNLYRYGTSANTVIPLNNTLPYILTTDRRSRKLAKIAKEWGTLNGTFNIYNGSTHLNYGDDLLPNNNQTYSKIYSLGLDAVFVKTHLKGENDYTIYNHDKQNHTIELLFYSQDIPKIYGAPNYNTAIVTNISLQTKNIPRTASGKLTLTYAKGAPVEITQGKYWLNIAIGRFQSADILPPTYSSNLLNTTMPTPQELNLHQFLPPSKITHGTGIQYVSLLPSGVLQVKLDGMPQYALKRLNALKYRLELRNITFIDNPINILSMSNNATISAVTPLRSIANSTTTLSLVIDTHKQVQLQIKQVGNSLFIFDNNAPNLIKNMATTVSVVNSNMEVTNNGITLTYTMSAPISIDTHMVGRQLFIRLSNKIDLSDSITNPQLFLNNYIDLTAFGTLYGQTTLTIIFRHDVDVTVSGKNSQLIINIKEA